MRSLVKNYKTVEHIFQLLSYDLGSLPTVKYFVPIISGKSWVITTSFPNKVINPIAINMLLRVMRIKMLEILIITRHTPARRDTHILICKQHFGKQNLAC